MTFLGSDFFETVYDIDYSAFSSSKLKLPRIIGIQRIMFIVLVVLLEQEEEALHLASSPRYNLMFFIFPNVLIEFLQATVYGWWY